ncbi:MAG: MFS transporter [Crocinitomicaceae bacterium]|nr:MFS transporter [Crocinitomicaceae bacterium]
MSLIDQTLDDKSYAPVKERTGEMIKLLLLYFLDRAAYYGLRAILVLYLVEAYNGDNSTPLYIYGLFTGCVYVVSYLGGALGDFVFGTKKALFIGLLISGIGSILLGVFGSHFVYFTLFIVALGNGITRPNILAQTAKSFYETRKGLSKVFVSSYLMINLGALVGAFITGLLFTFIGFLFTMLIVGLIYIIASIIVVSGDFNEPSKSASKNHRIKQRSPLNLLRMLIPFVAISLFWFLFEVGYIDYLSPIFTNMNTSLQNIFGEIGFQLSNLIPLTIFGILLLIFNKKINLSFSKIIGFGILISTFTWIIVFALSYFMWESPNIIESGIIISLFALVEILMSPIILALIAWKTSNQLMGTTYSIYLLITYLFTRLTRYVGEFQNLTVIIIYVALVIFTGLGIFMFFMHHFFPKEDSEIKSKNLI